MSEHLAHFWNSTGCLRPSWIEDLVIKPLEILEPLGRHSTAGESMPFLCAKGLLDFDWVIGQRSLAMLRTLNWPMKNKFLPCIADWLIAC